MAWLICPGALAPAVTAQLLLNEGKGREGKRREGEKEARRKQERDEREEWKDALGAVSPRFH